MAASQLNYVELSWTVFSCLTFQQNDLRSPDFSAAGFVQTPGAGQAVCYLGLLRGFRRVKDAVADQIVADFLGKYLAVVVEHAVTVPEGFDLESYKDDDLCYMTYSCFCESLWASRQGNATATSVDFIIWRMKIHEGQICE